MGPVLTTSPERTRSQQLRFIILWFFSNVHRNLRPRNPPIAPANVRGDLAKLVCLKQQPITRILIEDLKAITVMRLRRQNVHKEPTTLIRRTLVIFRRHVLPLRREYEIRDALPKRRGTTWVKIMIHSFLLSLRHTCDVMGLMGKAYVDTYCTTSSKVFVCSRGLVVSSNVSVTTKRGI